MIRGMVGKNWSLKKRWPLFAGGIFLLMLAYHGEAMVKSTHILDFYLEYRTPAPSSSNQLVERASKDIIENISTSVNELGHINIDEGESGNGWYHENHHLGLFYLFCVYVDIRNSIDGDNRGSIKNKTLLTELYVLETQLPYSYDIDIEDRPYYGQYHYPSVYSYPYPGITFSDYDDGSDLSHAEVRWLKAYGGKEIWRRVQKKFQWD